MKTKTNPAAIGLFIVLGVALGIAGIIVFSSARLFTRTDRFILYFDASLKGLSIGAPVKYRGVTIGSVVDVRIRFNQAEHDYHMPVIIEINESMLQEKLDERIEASADRTLSRRIKNGLRGKLEAQSLVTGVLYIELDMLDNPPPAVYHQIKAIYSEIPTAPTSIQQLLDNLAHLDVRGLLDGFNATLDRLNDTIEQARIGEISTSITNLLASAQHKVDSLDVTNTIASLQGTLEEFRLLAAKLRGRVDGLADDATNTLADARKTLQELQLGVSDFRDTLSPDRPLRRDLAETLDQLSETAQALTALADFLTRNPNALISGRQRTPAKP